MLCRTGCRRDSPVGENGRVRLFPQGRFGLQRERFGRIKRRRNGVCPPDLRRKRLRGALAGDLDGPVCACACGMRRGEPQARSRRQNKKNRIAMRFP